MKISFLFSSVRFWTAGVLTLWLLAATPFALADTPRIVPSSDGTPISYEVHGTGEPTLVFVHGWSCDSRYFREQVPVFSRENRVITIDLAGHGHSGSSPRTEYSMKSFGEDVQTVMRAVGGDSFILIGHSMGGIVVAEAARINPTPILGLVLVDTVENVEFSFSQEQFDNMAAPFLTNFPSACRAFVQTMLVPRTPQELRDWITADMSSANPAVAMSAFNQMLSLYVHGSVATLFEEVPLPVVGVYADLWPVDPEANRRHMRSFESIVLPGTDHFLQLGSPEKFNEALRQVIDLIPPKP